MSPAGASGTGRAFVPRPDACALVTSSAEPGSEKTVAGVTTLLMYDEAGHLLGEYSSTGALIQETVWMDDTPVATLRPNGSTVTIYYVHTDHLNAPRVVTQSSSDNSIRWLWGGNAANQNPLGLGTFVYNLRYPGQYYQAETGLSYNYFRDYDPVTGRYIESDPIGLWGGINTYAYVEGNPVSFVDPTGLAWCDVQDMVAMARQDNPDINIPLPTLTNIPDYLLWSNHRRRRWALALEHARGQFKAIWGDTKRGSTY